MKHAKLVLVAVCMALIAAACTGRKAYDAYVHTPIQGWEKNDPLTFSVPAIAAAGHYEATLGLRIHESYPFTAVTLIVEQQVFPAGARLTDTLTCRLVDEGGNTTGHGVSYYQYSFPVRDLTLHAGDSLQVSVRHDMKREILPGICDIGYKLARP